MNVKGEPSMGKVFFFAGKIMVFIESNTDDD